MHGMGQMSSVHCQTLRSMAAAPFMTGMAIQALQQDTLHAEGNAHCLMST